MKLNQDLPIRMLRPVPRSLEGEAFGYKNLVLFRSIIARMLRPYIYKNAIAFSLVISVLAKRSR